MTLPLPNLDDRRWDDLVEEARALIPVYAPQWTDHNIHDPGITLIELLAWIAEMDIYQVNRIPDTHRLKLLSLVGVRPRPPHGAQTAVTIQLNPGAPVTELAAGTQLEMRRAQDRPIRFRLLNPLTVAPLRLQAVQVQIGSTFTNSGDKHKRGESIPVFGEDPHPGNALYLGFKPEPLVPAGKPVSFFMQVSSTLEGEREQLRQCAAERQRLCQPSPSLVCCETEETASQTTTPSTESPLEHHAVRLVWEAHVGNGHWRALPSDTVRDETRAFTLSGPVIVQWPGDIMPAALGQVADSLCYLRCRLLFGGYDAAPALAALSLNGVSVEQSVAVGELTWVIAPGATIEGNSPVAGNLARFTVQFNTDEQVTTLRFDVPEAPQFLVLAYQPSTPFQAGRLVFEASHIGIGTGQPNQELTLPQVSVTDASLRIFTLQDGFWRKWLQQPDFVRASRSDRYFALDAEQGRIRFGDGEHGRVMPSGAKVTAYYRSTVGEAGNVAAGTLFMLADTAHNRAILDDYDEIATKLGAIINPRAAASGTSSEGLAAAAARAAEAVEKTERAVTLADYEALALSTPGLRLARVAARANQHPAFPCYQATGVIMVIILPFLPIDRPMPGPQLLGSVKGYLSSRRVLGTRVEVVGPRYVEVLVRAKVRACQGINLEALSQRIRDALNAFFHPLRGGPEGAGWPFGRDVYRSEVLQTIDETEGADHVVFLELASGEKLSCRNICLPSDGLVAAGDHEIEVLGAEQ